MSEDTRNDAPEGEVGADRPEDARRKQDDPLLGFRVGGGQARGHAARHAANEFVRETILALARDQGARLPAPLPRRWRR